MGHERTQNPSLAAAALLKSSLGRRKLGSVLKGLRRRRRSFYRGNPVPALAVAALSKVGFLKGLGKTPSEKRAGKVASALISSAVQGNLTAAKAIEARQSIGIMKERSVWQAAWAQVPTKIKALLKKYAELVPGVDHSTPETAAQEALARAVDANELEDQAREEMASARRERGAASAASAAAAERREARLTELGVGVAGAIARGARRQPRRRRKRRSSGRAFSF